MNWNDSLKLVEKIYGVDEYNHQKPIGSKFTEVLCKEKSIVYGEFYVANQSNYKPEINLIIKRFEYDNQRIVIYKGIEYSVIRHFSKNYEEIELICERKLSNV